MGTPTRRRRTRPRVRHLTAGIALASLGLGLGGVAFAAPTHADGLRTISATGALGLVPSGAVLGPGASVQSPNKAVTLAMQSDGNLVLYAGGRALWNTGTWGNPGAIAAQQTDGNLVVYSGSGRALWWSGTNGRGATTLAVQDDGNLVQYTAAGAAVWASGTSGSRLVPGSVLLPGQELVSPSARYGLRLAVDGRLSLVDRATGQVLRQSNRTDGTPTGVRLTVGSGRVVISSDGTTLWQMLLEPGATSLVVTDDGSSTIRVVAMTASIVPVDPTADTGGYSWDGPR